MDTKTFREAAKAMVDDIADYYDSIDTRPPLSSVKPGYLRPLLPDEAPLRPEPWTALQSDLHSIVMPGITHWQSPRFMAFFPCANSFPAALADMWSGALSGAHFNWVCSPAVTELETVVLDWLAKALGLPACFLAEGPTRGGGVIHGSASEAILTVMVAARDKYLSEIKSPSDHDDDAEGQKRQGEFEKRRSRLVALGSSLAHSSTAKAARILGIDFVAVPVGPETGWAMTAEALANTVRECRARGLEPFYATVTFGTTDTCAVDELAPIAAVNAAESSPPSSPFAELWLHVDAAYAGAAMVCPEYRPAPAHLASLASYHSFNFNPHKWLLTTFDCSALWVRSRAHLVDALSITPPYLRNRHSDAALVTDYRDWQIPLGRRFRSLKLWWVMRAYGIEGLQAHIRKGCRLGERLETLLRTRDDLFELVSGARFALLVFALRGPAVAATTAGLERQNEATKRLYDWLTDGGEIYLTSTVLEGKFAIRICTGVASVEEDHVDRAFRVLVRGAEKILTSWARL